MPGHQVREFLGSWAMPVHPELESPPFGRNRAQREVSEALPIKDRRHPQGPRVSDDSAINRILLRGEEAENRQSRGQPQVKAVKPLTATDCHRRPFLHSWLKQGLTQDIGIYLPPIIYSKTYRLPVEGNQPLSVLSGTLHRHKTTQLVGPAYQVSVLTLEHNRSSKAAHTKGDDEAAALDELLLPGRRNVPSSSGNDHAIVGSMLDHTACGVGQHHVHLIIPCRCEAALGTVNHVRVDVYRSDRSFGSDQLGDQRGVIAARPDLQHPHTHSQLCLLQHHGLKPGRRDRADGKTMLVPLGDQGPVGVVDSLQRMLRREEVPRHGAERFSDPGTTDVSLSTQLPNHRLAQRVSPRGLANATTMLFVCIQLIAPFKVRVLNGVRPQRPE